MTTYVGSEAVLLVGGTPTAVGGILQWELEESIANLVEDTGLNDTTRKLLSGSKLRTQWNGTVRYKYDWNDGPQGDLDIAALVAAEFYPSGNTSSHLKATGSFVITRKRLVAMEDNGATVHEVDFEGTGALTWATVS